MAANPLLPSEIEAYERKALVTFSAWQFDLICRLDTAVRAAWSSKEPKPTRARGDRQIPATNIKGLKAFFSDLAQRREAREKAHPN